MRENSIFACKFQNLFISLHQIYNKVKLKLEYMDINPMKFIDVSNWVETYAASTKGTRDKLVLMEPGTVDTYFLKFPMNKPGRDYTPENWSEVIAYELGNYFGFDVLEYNLAVYRGKVGCISKNMVRSSDNELLVEGHFYFVKI